MKLYVIEAILPHVQIQELDGAIAHWSGSSDPSTFAYVQILQAARLAGVSQVIENVPGDPLNVAEVFTFEEWPRIIDDFDLRRFLADPNAPLTIDVYPAELRAILDESGSPA